jgi:NAD(P)-dependent dehydrogenase (short-subunit alcohol dehydrogenase family)
MGGIMKEFKEKVAVITGAASGIGRAMAERFAGEQMKVVLADIEEAALASAEKEMAGEGATVLAVRTDVSKADDVESLADKAFEAFGAVHLLCNNAGVAPPFGVTWERTLKDWEWVLGVNLWGVIHGIHSFVPRMIEQDSEGSIVNTASEAGITSSPGFAVYYATKHAVVGISETLHHDLALARSKLKVSVVCPWWVKTGIFDSDRNRPAELQNEPTSGKRRKRDEIMEKMSRQTLDAAGQNPSEVAEMVFEAVRDERFYVITHPDIKGRVRQRMEDILEGRNPVFEARF